MSQFRRFFGNFARIAPAFTSFTLFRPGAIDLSGGNNNKPKRTLFDYGLVKGPFDPTKFNIPTHITNSVNRHVLNLCAPESNKRGSYKSSKITPEDKYNLGKFAYRQVGPKSQGIKEAQILGKKKYKFKPPYNSIKDWRKKYSNLTLALGIFCIVSLHFQYLISPFPIIT
eukprot:160974_1